MTGSENHSAIPDTASDERAWARRVLGRTGREWVIDAVFFVAAVVYAGCFSFLAVGVQGRPPGTIATAFVFSAVAAAVAIPLRRRWPVAVAVLLIPVATVNDLTGGAQLIALLTVAIHRPVITTVVVATLRLLAVFVYVPLRAATQLPADLMVWVLAFTTAMTVGAVGWGLFIRHRRQLILSLRERAVRAEIEARLRTEQAQHLVREEIAREMHDVLGHRLSLLSVHAGALEFNPHAPPAEIARAAGVIRESTHQALQDLRGVIGVLRAPVGELPQPTYAELPELIEESAAGGMRIEFHDQLPVDKRAHIPDLVGRTAYRVVREALTNVRRHAPGADVTVTVSGSPGSDLFVEVRNGPAAGPVGAAGSGHGLLGLVERARIAGGRLEHGPTTDAGFRVAARLPWPA